MGLLSFLFSRRDKEPPGMGFEVHAGEDTDEMVAGESLDPDFRLAGMRVGMIYEDVRAQRTKRVVRLQRLDANEHAGYLHAYCELRGENRTFRLDRIDVLYDPASGEILGEAGAFFAPYIEHSLAEEEHAYEKSRYRGAWDTIEALRDELAILILVARADGRFVKAEQTMMLRYASERAKELEIDLDDHAQVILLGWIKTQDPSEPEMRIALRRLSKSETALQSIWEVSELIAEADGKIRDQELSAFKEIRRAIEQIAVQEANRVAP